ncbi:MAG: enoyl-CoA hydratase/isomerase family protein [Bdellovibrionales bacterium]|nr:enoyl-CoA hydratase/isomerase family protein [Bdellovibrionales bacterium]
MGFETIEFKKSETNEYVGVLTINRPKALNALNSQVIDELEGFRDEIAGTDLRVIVVTGSGEKSFVAGADIKEMKNHSAEDALRMARRGQGVFGLLSGMGKTMVAAVNGFALGGGMELALACDVIFASEKAKFGLPEVSLGLIPGYGGTQRLARNIGVSKAKYFALSGDIFSASQAYEMGLVSKVFAPEELMPGAMKFADTVASRAPLAVAKAKMAIEDGLSLDLKAALELEAKCFSEIFNTEDKTEGIAAFIEKRQPNFQGK